MAVDKMVQKTNLSVLVSTGSWGEQFTEALSVSTGKSFKLLVELFSLKS